MSKIILAAETGSDLPPELAAQYGVHLIPMHVAFDDAVCEDGAFPPEKIVAHYQRTGRLPKTSAAAPEDFARAFDAIHAQAPQARILYLAYSAATTCSYQNALLAAEGRDYVTPVNTRQVSAGQGAIVLRMAKLLQRSPSLQIKQAAALAGHLVERARFCFLPDNLEFLRAGGRVSNAAFLGSRILSLHPCIELRQGKLVAAKKYRGRMPAVAAQLVRDYAETYNLQREELWFVCTCGLDDAVRRAAEAAARQCGFGRLHWIKAGGVITAHGGPGAFGLAGFARK